MSNNDPFITSNYNHAAVLVARGEKLAEVRPVGDKVIFRFEPGREMMDARGADNYAIQQFETPIDHETLSRAQQEVIALSNRAQHTVKAVKLEEALQETQNYTRKAAEKGNPELHRRMIEAYHSGDAQALLDVKEAAAEYLRQQYILKNDLA